MKRHKELLLLIIAIFFFIGCFKAVPKTSVKKLDIFTPVAAAGINFADDLDSESLQLAVERSIHYYDTAGRNKIYRIAGRLISAEQLKKTLISFRDVLREKGFSKYFEEKIAADFNIYRIEGAADSETALFTGYYEPLLEGSLQQTEKYRYPLYKVPPDLIKKESKLGRMEKGSFVPYYSRREIDVEGVLQGRKLELIWVSDPVDLFSLHIQGSGKVKLEDGTVMSVGFAQSNGRPFRSVTKFMLDSGKIGAGEASYRHPFLREKEEEEILNALSHNERYVFFRFLQGEPIGSLGEPVTPGRTIATDPDYFPEGALAFIRLRKPVFDAEGKVKEKVDFSRFVLNQDKGSAILGPGRVDVFCGFGDEAENMAGTLKEQGELYLLLKK
jgi:membrane-bound lytic murein transglycosylase A